MAEVLELEQAQKIILLKYFKEKKDDYTYIRENETLRKIVERLQEKYELSNRAKVYELAVLSLSLRIPPEKLAPLLKMRTRSDSKKSLLKAIEELV
jgi:hypothetical protein